MKRRTAVLIPSYNEAKTIGGIVERLKREGANVYVVDDGSTDQTGSIASSSGAVVLTHEFNRGKGASLKEGFSRILEDGFEYILVMDGDGQHHIGDIDTFFARMSETCAGIVIGNRMSDTHLMPLLRVAINKAMSFIISAVSGQEIPDTQCGFRLIRREVLENLVLNSANYETESELLLKASRKGWKITSVPIRTIYEDEKSGIHPVKDTKRFISLMLKMLAKREL